MEKQFTTDCHYVPKFYLRYWSKDGKMVPVYRTVVKSKVDDLWRLYSVKSLPKVKNLYTASSDGEDNDNLEKWFNSEIETPASEVIQDIIYGKHLAKEQYDVLIRYLAAQCVRTPAFFYKNQRLLQDKMPQIISGGLNDAFNQLKTLSFDNFQKTNTNQKVHPSYPIRVHTYIDSPKPYIKVEALEGREMWQSTITHLLTSTEKILHNHKWSIIKAPFGLNWATSDDPVICLNYTDINHYDFLGGWGKKNGNIIFPLTPDFLMFTKIGSNKVIKKADMNFYSLMQKIIIEHAFLYVFAKEPIKRMFRFRPREANADTYDKKVALWQQWGEYQHIAEEVWRNEQH